MSSDPMRSTYVMEGPDEIKRLEWQSTLPGYRVSRELEAVTLAPWSRALDAGCGTGIGARHLAATYPGTHVEGCDRSEERLAAARRLSAAEGVGQIQYFASDVHAIARRDASYDLVLCRYVLEHLEDPGPVAREFRRLLRPGGQVVAIDLDGVLLNLQGASPRLQQQLRKLKSSPRLDLRFGRKLAATLLDAGFVDVTWDVQEVTFPQDQRSSERQLTETRLRLAHSWVAEALGSAEEARRFAADYLAALEEDTTTLSYSKFIATGARPDAA